MIVNPHPLQKNHHLLVLVEDIVSVDDIALHRKAYWLMVGNTVTQCVNLIQFVEYIGWIVLGLSR